MKKRLLEIILQELMDVPNPDPSLEQYPTPPSIGSDLIFQAYGMGDIGNKRVCEPGCGNGLLALGAALMGTSCITGFDIDKKAVDIANRNLEYLKRKGYEIDGEFFTALLPDLSISERWDTIVMNPPFGSQRHGADRPFLRFAGEHCNVMYSLHLAKTEDFVIRFLKTLGFQGKIMGYYTFPIKYTFGFHTKEKMDFKVALVRGCKEKKR